MSGVVFIIGIPSAQYENMSRKNQESIKENFSDVSNPNQLLEEQIILNSENCNHAGKDDNSPINDQTKFESMEKALRSILSTLNIKNAIWQRDINFIQVIFSLTTDDRCEEVLALLNENSIGRLFDSSVSVVPCTVYYHVEADNRIKELQNIEETEKSSTWRRFVSSVKARLTVAQVVENVRNRAELTFDFVCLVSIATILCAIGLIENNNVYLLSSMLISPMMGPVMAGTFGSVVQDKCLLKIGVLNELIGLGIATLIGFCYGCVICLLTDDKYGEQDWPTYEMTSRGELRTLWIGCLIGLLSGAAVALGILSDNIASLVGVAISTSLMPPAVNAGLLWSLAGVYYIKRDISSTKFSGLKRTGYYSTDPLKELVFLGAVSMCLTFVNIVCIYVAGVLVFKIKEVAPMASKCHYKKQFWTRDIKIARDYNKTLQSGEGHAILPIFSHHLYDFHRDQGQTRQQTLSDHFMFYSTDLSKENPKISTRRNQKTWSFCARKPSDVGKFICSEKYNSSVCDSSSTLNIKTSVLRHDLSRMFDSCNANANFSNIETDNVKAKSSETVMSINSRKFIVTPSTYDPLK